MSYGAERRPQRSLRQVATAFTIAWAAAIVGASTAAAYRGPDSAPAPAEVVPVAFAPPLPTAPDTPRPQKPKATVVARPAPAPAPVATVAARPQEVREPTASVLPTVQVAVTTNIYDAQEHIDLCVGPVLFTWGTPVIGEHDYCGGTYHLGRHEVGDKVRVSGSGSWDGTWIVERIRYVPKGTDAGVLASTGDLVFQTCISDSSLQLTGLSRVE